MRASWSASGGRVSDAPAVSDDGVDDEPQPAKPTARTAVEAPTMRARCNTTSTLLALARRAESGTAW